MTRHIFSDTITAVQSMEMSAGYSHGPREPFAVPNLVAVLFALL